VSKILDPPPRVSVEYPTRYAFHKLISKLQIANANGASFDMVEVGLGFGDFSCYMMESISPTYVHIPCTYHCVESWVGRMMKTQMIEVRDQVVARFDKYKPLPEDHPEYDDSQKYRYFNWNLIEKSSADASQDFDDESLDYIYIDADHSYSHALQDYRKWWPKLKPGGFFAGHDYAGFRRDGVRRAVKSFFQDDLEMRYEVFVTADVNPHPSFYVFKNE